MFFQCCRALARPMLGLCLKCKAVNPSLQLAFCNVFRCFLDYASTYRFIFISSKKVKEAAK